MCCYRSKRCRNREDNVLGDSGIQRIALRGPGCIDGTGQCENVLGTGGGVCCGNVLGTGGVCCGNVLGDSGRRCGNVLGDSGSDCENVLGDSGRRRINRFRGCYCQCFWDALETPTTVPR